MGSVPGAGTACCVSLYILCVPTVRCACCGSTLAVRNLDCFLDLVSGRACAVWSTWPGPFLLHRGVGGGWTFISLELLTRSCDYSFLSV